jgi:hypothetical protein
MYVWTRERGLTDIYPTLTLHNTTSYVKFSANRQPFSSINYFDGLDLSTPCKQWPIVSSLNHNRPTDITTTSVIKPLLDFISKQELPDDVLIRKETFRAKQTFIENSIIGKQTMIDIANFNTMLSLRATIRSVPVYEHMLANGLSVTKSTFRIDDIQPDNIDSNLIKEIIGSDYIYEMDTDEGGVFNTVICYNVVNGICKYAVFVNRRGTTIEVTEFSESNSGPGQLVEPLKHYFNSVTTRSMDAAVIANVTQFNVGGELRYKSMFIHRATYPITNVLYPTYKGGDITHLSAEFNRANANLLLLMGAPGTGKTTLIRDIAIDHYVNHHRHLIYITGDDLIKDPNISGALKRITKPTTIMFEDCDAMIAKRENGNALMSTLLNVLDGVIDYDVKFIISTNLTSLNKVDSALLRTGRAYKIIDFKLLTKEQAIAIKRELAMEVDQDIKEHNTLSDILNVSDNSNKTAPFGFV